MQDEKTKLRAMCHELFDMFWLTKSGRAAKYRKLAKELGIPTGKCHFSMMDEKTLRRAYGILSEWVVQASRKRR